MKKQIFLFAAAILGVCSLFSACKKEEATTQYAQVNIIQTSPDAPGLNAFLDSNTQLNSFVLLYLANTGYRPVDISKKSVQFLTYRVDSVDTLTLKSDIMLKQNNHYSLFVIDSFSKISSLLVPDDLVSAENGKALVRFIQLSPNVPRLDLAKHGDGSVVFGNMFFRDVTAFTPLDAGVYDLDLRVAGSGNIITRLPTMVFSTGKIYTVYTRGFWGATDKTALSSSVINN